MGDQEVKLFGLWASPFSKRVEIALKIKGISYEYVAEDILNKSPELLKYNPVHKKLPVLLHNGKPICESLVILEYIDETWESRPSILPKDPFARAMARFWAKFIDDKIMLLTSFNIFRRMENYVNVNFFWGGRILRQGDDIRYSKDPSDQRYVMLGTKYEEGSCTCIAAMWSIQMSLEGQEKAIEELTEHLKTLENELKGKKFFGGDEIGLVDIIANLIAFWLGVLLELKGIELLTKEKFPRLCEWVDDYLDNSVIKETLPARENFKKYPSNVLEI